MKGVTRYRLQVTKQLLICMMQRMAFLPKPIVDPNIRLDGHVVIITGGNRGIGRGAVELFVRLGARVIIATCEMDQARQVVIENPGAQIDVKFLDLASFKSVRSFAESILTHESRIDCLINNAAVMEGCYKETEDGIERAKQINFLSPLLLTSLLLPVLEKSQGRVINMASISHLEIDSMNLNDSDWWHSKENYDTIKTYKITKLAVLLTTRYLSGKLPSVKIYAVDPGVARTKMAHVLYKKKFERALISGLNYFLRSPIEAAVSSVLAAIDSSGEYTPGQKYLMYYGKYIKGSPVAKDDLNAAAMWTHAFDLIGHQLK